jgi:hypothetical protein
MRYSIKLTVLLLLIIKISTAQIFVRAFNYRPTGEFGFAFKPTYSAEIGYMPEFEDDSWIRICASATYLVMKPRLDTFPIFAVKSGNGTSVLPGQQSFQKYNLLLAHGGIDVAVFKREKFFAYIGTDIMIGAASVEYTSNVNTLITEGYSGGGVIAGGRFRLGLQYNVTYSIGIIAHVSRTVGLLSEPRALNWANDYGIGIRYQFDY